jgi:hypothetical protein
MIGALNRPVLVCAIYVALTCMMTWPVAAGLARDLPSDLGDPMFVAGMLTWASTLWLELLSGDLTAATRFWNAPFFYPEPLVTALSEHFTLHAFLTLPVYAFTHNIVLCYNLLFLSAFGLSGFGMYLFVRELTGRPLAAFVAGLAFAFAPYRVAVTPHLQVLSSQWMPFALYGLRRYFVTGRLRPLAGGALALWAQHLSSGYYMVYFGPFVALYVLAEIATRRLWANAKVWLHLASTGAAAVLLTLPFAVPYLIVQRQYPRRSLRELTDYSADLLGWLTASPWMKVWGGLNTYQKAEGFLFPGVTVVILAVAGIASGWRLMRSRDMAAQGTRAIAVFGLLAIALSFWMSLGPEVELRKQATGVPAIYRLAYDHLPGYDRARVPARFTMIAVFALASCAGVALALIERKRPWLVAACGVLLLAEGAAFPFPTNGNWSSAPALVPAEGRAYPEREAPPVYTYLATLPNAVIAHLPFGAPEREIQYVYYAAMHRRRIVNGYSGAFPSTYLWRLADMQTATENPRAANERMIYDGVTHVVIHTGAWTGDAGRNLVATFDQARGYERVAQFGDDYVFRLIY